VKPICGWPQIAKAVSRALGCSVSKRTAQRYARPARPHRLPVFRYDNGRVYLMPGALRLWVNTRAMPLGGRLPGGDGQHTDVPPRERAFVQRRNNAQAPTTKAPPEAPPA
jgi:hypothetical protein